jgi:DNA-binding transcriptional MocR family regulator
MRLAWLAGTPEAIEPIARVRQDFGVAQILARAVMIYMQRGKFLPHVAAMRDIYRTKRNVAVDALRQYCGAHVRYRIPGGGFYLWLEVSDSIDWNQARQLAAQAGVAFRPGDRFTAGANGPQFVRLSWAQTDLDDIEEGISILGGALARSVR